MKLKLWKQGGNWWLSQTDCMVRYWQFKSWEEAWEVVCRVL